MSWIDSAIIVLYFAVVVGLGFRFRRRAGRSLNSYFLGGKSMHWLPLAMSGAVSNFDITGTMWIVSILYLLGMKSMWHHWMWGVMMGAFFMAYMGKWVRRSNVLTAAEWMETRFGNRAAGKMARTTYAVMAVLTQASFIGYAFQGIGKFAAVYIPLDVWGASSSQAWLRHLLTTHESEVLAVLIIGLTTFYVILGGLFSVVVTDVVQTAILTLGSVFIAGAAWLRIRPGMLERLPDHFTSLRIPWRIPEFAGTDHAAFEFFGALVIVWIAKGLLMNAGGPSQMYDFQRFLAARNDRDAAKIGAAWSFFLVVRWAMAMGIALIALTGIAGVADAEQVMPLVLREFLPLGMRGLVIAGLLAAFMSTFSSTVNSGAAFIVKDIWLPFIRPNAGEKEAVRFSYVATLVLVGIGLAIGFQGGSIASIWNWMMMALGAGVIVPNVMRWYWWRMNGWGYAWGTLSGMALSLIALFWPAAPSFLVFPAIAGLSLAVSGVVSLLTPSVDRTVLEKFYRTVRPFGNWRPVRRRIERKGSTGRADSSILGVLNVILGMIAVSGLYLSPMYLVGHWYSAAAIWLGAALVAVIVLRFTWYKNLPPSLPDP